MTAKHLSTSLGVVALMVLAAAPLKAICWGSLYVASRSVQLLTQCPTPVLTKTWQIHCFDGCGHSDGSFFSSLVGFGECFKNPNCSTPRIVCLPLSGSDIHGYNPPSLSSAIVNRAGYYQVYPCGSPSCRSAGVNTITIYCNCDGGSRPPWCDANDPVIVSLGDASYRLTDRAGGVEFDLGANGDPQQVPWTNPAGDEAFLVLDRNGNGAIDDGSELFGDVTPQHASPEPNGFRALALFDDVLSGGNEDGRISAADEIFAQLRLWRDANHNGVSEPLELQSLFEAGLEAIELDHQSSARVDPHGNEFRYLADSLWSSGSRRRVWNVFLVAE